MGRLYNLPTDKFTMKINDPSVMGYEDVLEIFLPKHCFTVNHVKKKLSKHLFWWSKWLQICHQKKNNLFRPIEKIIIGFLRGGGLPGDGVTGEP